MTRYPSSAPTSLEEKLGQDAEKMSLNPALVLANQRRAELRAQGIAPEALDPIQKARLNSTSLRAAINGKCWDCANESRQAIRDCDITGCTLRPVRPYQRADQ